MRSASKQKGKSKQPPNGPLRKSNRRESVGKEPTPPPKPVGRRLSLSTTEEIYKLLKTTANDRKQGLITVEEAKCMTYICHELFAQRAGLDVQKEMDELRELYKRSPHYAKPV